MKFKKNIIYVLKDRNISIKDFCKSINVGKNLIYDLDKHLPTTINAIKISNSIGYSLDYLLGRTDEQNNFKKLNVNNFIINLEKILKDVNKSKFCKDLNLSTDCWTRWKNGAVPHLLTVIEIADYFKCSIDDLLDKE